MMGMGDRGAVNLVTVIMTFVVLVVIIVLSPIFVRFQQMVAAEADPFSALLLQAFLPILVLALVISVGESARSGA